MKKLTFTVAIPTYKRPDYVCKAVNSIFTQIKQPEYLILIYRDTDVETKEKIDEIIINYKGKIKIKSIEVTDPGFLPPVICAFENATTDVVALMDDDAIAHRDWLEKIAETYEGDDEVVGVGGRVVDIVDGQEVIYETAKKVGIINWYGKAIGNMYKNTSGPSKRNVDFLMGGNLSYKTEAARKSLPDKILGNNVAFHWEMDVGLKIKKSGKKIIYNAQAKVDHFTAPRPELGMREVNYDGIYWYNFNYLSILKKHRSPMTYFMYILYSILVGDRAVPGIIYVFAAILRGRKISLNKQLIPSVKGRFFAIIR